MTQNNAIALLLLFLFPLVLLANPNVDCHNASPIYWPESNGHPIIIDGSTMEPEESITINRCGSLSPVSSTGGAWYEFLSGRNNFVSIRFVEPSSYPFFAVQVTLFTAGEHENSCDQQVCIDYKYTPLVNDTKIETNILSNRKYYILVETQDEEQSYFAFYFHITRQVRASDNEDIGNAVEILYSKQLIMGSTIYANPPSGGIDYCTGEPLHSGLLWYLFNSQLYNYLIASTCINGGGSDFNSRLVLYQLDESLICLEVNDDYYKIYPSIITRIAPNQDFYLQVSGNSNNENGEFAIYFELLNIQQPINDHCENPVALELGIHQANILNANKVTIYESIPCFEGFTQFLFYTISTDENIFITISFTNNPLNDYLNTTAILLVPASGLTCPAEFSGLQTCSTIDKLTGDVLPFTTYYIILAITYHIDHSTHYFIEDLSTIGLFEFQVELFTFYSSVSNDECEFAYNLGTMSYYTRSGETFPATADLVQSGNGYCDESGAFESRNIWYYIDAFTIDNMNVNRVIVSFCDSYSGTYASFYPSIYLFESSTVDCSGGLQCKARDSYPSKYCANQLPHLQYPIEGGTGMNYFISIAGAYPDQSGVLNFYYEFTYAGYPSNYECALANDFYPEETKRSVEAQIPLYLYEINQLPITKRYTLPECILGEYSSDFLNKIESNEYSSVWYTFETTVENFVVISTCGQSFDNTIYHSVIQLFEGEDCATLSCMASSSYDSCYDSDYHRFRLATVLSSEVSPLTRYYFSLIFRNLNYSQYQYLDFEITFLVNGAPMNDECMAATLIDTQSESQQPLTGLFQSSMMDLDVPMTVEFACPSKDFEYYSTNMWYTFNSETFNHVTISSCEDTTGYYNDMELIINLYQYEPSEQAPDCSSVPVYCIAQSTTCYGTGVELTAFLSNSTTYLIELINLHNQDGLFNLAFSVEQLEVWECPNNDECFYPQVVDINDNYPVYGNIQNATINLPEND